MKPLSIHISKSGQCKQINVAWKTFVLLAMVSFIAIFSFAQSGALMDFTNPVLEVGDPGADNSTYRFTSIATNIDALVTITGRSDALVNLLNTDMNTSGFDGAFQPQVGYNNGTAPGAADWWMEFKIQFVETGTNIPATITDFNVSGVDIDGNGEYINEYLSFYGMSDYTLESTSGLSITTLTDTINGTEVTVGRRFDGPTGNYTNIDTGATAVMVSNHYVNSSEFIVRTGGRSTNVSAASDRMYSFYFRNFSYNTPQNTILPIKSRARGSRKSFDDKVSVTVFPNPVSNYFNITLPARLKNKSIGICLFDMNGRIVLQQNKYSSNTSMQIGVSFLKPGIYILQISSDTEKLIHRISRQ